MKLNEIDLNSRLLNPVFRNRDNKYWATKSYYWVCAVMRKLNYQQGTPEDNEPWFAEEPRIVDPDGWGEKVITITHDYTWMTSGKKRIDDYTLTVEDIQKFIQANNGEINDQIIMNFLKYIKDKDIIFS